nr:DUF3987 domain-containing protein [uncultured Rhodopila sp.]
MSESPGGIGLVLGTWSDGYCVGGVDLDACRDPETGTLAPWAQKVLALIDTYSEVSPSGTGVKAFFQILPDAVDALRASGLLEPTGFGRSFKRGTGGDHPPAIEVHLGGRYYTVTRDRLPDFPADLRCVPTETLRDLLGEIGLQFAKNDGDGSRPDRSARAFRLAREMRAAGKSQAEFETHLDADPELAAWKAEKGLPDNKRELCRAWNRSFGDAWGSPNLALITDDTLPAVQLPLALFPAEWPAWIGQAAQRAGSPVDYVACTVLAVVSATIGNARWGSPWEGWVQVPVINVASVGLSSSGKSPAMDVVVGPLNELAADLDSDWVERVSAYKTEALMAKELYALWEEGVKKAAKEKRPPPAMPAEAREPEPPRRRRIVSSDPTMEAARDLSVSNPRGLLLSRDELAGFFSGMGKYGGSAGSDRAFWLQTYDGRPWVSDRAKDRDTAPSIPHLTWVILGGIQPDRLASTLLEGDDDGLAERFIYAWPAPSREVSPPPDGKPLPFELKVALRRLRELPMPDNEPVVLPFTDDAVAALQVWRHDVKSMEDDAGGLLQSWIGKLPGIAVRLATIFAHMKWMLIPDGTPAPERITADDLTPAVGFLASYALPMARRAFGEAALPEAERDARRLARWYLKCPAPRPEVLNARELRRKANGPGITTSKRIEAALEELAELGFVQPAPTREGATKGRQRADWTVNPAIREVEA